MILVQLTDLHIKPPGRRAYREVDTAACLDAVIDDLQALPFRPDVVLLTGDLTDAGLEEEYALLRQKLARIDLPLFLMPGNHDLRANLRAAFPEHAYLGVGDGPVHYTVETFPLRLIALDSVVPGEGGGALGAEQLAWLDARLSEQPQRPTLVALHHAPFVTGIGHMDEIGLADAAALAEVIGRHPQVERVVAGHLHRPIQARWAGTLASTAPSTAHQVTLDLRAEAPSTFFLEPPGYQLHWFTPATGVISHTATVGRWPGPFPFFDGDTLID
ncbi:phosphodiesterase [Rhodovastum atsumiense]|uniref:Phosphodiesterase n=2 Tax=Rhodovastum atsumiense TaxID=504468 RepID=A0A5M6IRF9_9PROT|nr:phosphodiesterase [Rhodovastum atsumiense]